MPPARNHLSIELFHRRVPLRTTLHRHPPEVIAGLIDERRHQANEITADLGTHMIANLLEKLAAAGIVLLRDSRFDRSPALVGIEIRLSIHGSFSSYIVQLNG